MISTMLETSTNAGLQQDVFTLSQAPISWRSTLQSTITLSTMEAEYMVRTEALKDTIWLQGLFDGLKIDQDLLKINCDNISAIYLAKNLVYDERTKHIDIRFHFIQEIFDEGEIKLQKIHTKENPANVLTKVVSGVKLAHYKELIHIMLCELSGAYLDELCGLIPLGMGT